MTEEERRNCLYPVTSRPQGLSKADRQIPEATEEMTDTLDHSKV